MKKRDTKRAIFEFVFAVFVLMALISFASGGFNDWFKATITGRGTTQNVSINITVTDTTTPNITFVQGPSSVSITEADGVLININFTASDPDGVNNLDAVSGTANASRGANEVRKNQSCAKVVNNADANSANFSCTIYIAYFDSSGVWNVSVSINDTGGNTGYNSSSVASNGNNVSNFTLQQTSAFVAGPLAVTFPSITQNTKNQTANNDPITLNNTGNKNITAGNLQVNSTDLKGETDSTKQLSAGNFTISIYNGGSPPSECNTTDSTAMNKTFAPINNSLLMVGNFSAGDGITGQEQLYLCLRTAGTEVSSQAYSTANQGSWTIKII